MRSKRFNNPSQLAVRRPVDYRLDGIFIQIVPQVNVYFLRDGKTVNSILVTVE